MALFDIMEIQRILGVLDLAYVGEHWYVFIYTGRIL